ncbi:MAG: hypothetical protein QW791_08895 [Candidatus Bathyarchaeia archaeon]
MKPQLSSDVITVQTALLASSASKIMVNTQPNKALSKTLNIKAALTLGLKAGEPLDG